MNTLPLPSRPRLRTGFSLIELVMVMLIVGVISAIAVPRYTTSLHRYRVDSAARRIQADLELARSTARAKSSTQWVSFVPAADTYSTSFQSLDKPAELYAVDLKLQPYLIDLSGAAFGAGASLTSTIRFDGYGKPNLTGTVTLTRGTYSRHVTVDAATGAVAIP